MNQLEPAGTGRVLQGAAPASSHKVPAPHHAVQVCWMLCKLLELVNFYFYLKGKREFFSVRCPVMQVCAGFHRGGVNLGFYPVSRAGPLLSRVPGT